MLFGCRLDVVHGQFVEPQHRARFVFWFIAVLVQCLRKSAVNIASVWLRATWKYTKASGMVFTVKGLMMSK